MRNNYTTPLLLALLLYLPSRAMEQKSQEFIPSKKTCGAAVTEQGTLVKDINNVIACMLKGYKSVYLGYPHNIVEILPDYLPLENLGIHIIKFKAFSLATQSDNFERVLLYTDEGCDNALLLKKYIEQRAQKDKEDWQANSSISEPNHYLMGHLLGYDEADISYFYEKNGFADFETDKLNAFEFIDFENMLC
jgi:hypothetical protein